MKLDGEISKYVHISQGVAEICGSSPTLLNTFIVNMITAETAKQGVRVGKYMVPGLMLADDFGGYQDHQADCMKK